MTEAGGRLEVDEIEGIPLPRTRVPLFGHRAGEREFLDAYRSGRLHHAWLLTGPRGIGKATFAFRVARFLERYPDPAAPEVAAAEDLSISGDDPLVGKVGSGAHPNILHLRIPWNEHTKRYRTELTVDEVRRSVGFFGSTAGERGWRVCIVDAIDDANRSAANALLKTLEEPPDRSLFLLVCNRPGRLLPTILSRCRKLALAPLGRDDLAAALDDLMPDSNHGAGDFDRVITYAEGSVRRACNLILAGGLEVVGAFEDIVAKLPRSDIAAIHALGDRVAPAAANDLYRILIDAVEYWLHGRLPEGSGGGPGNAALATVAEVWEKVHRSIQDAEIYNLDRKAVVLAVFRELSRVPG